ncbi:MAG TPA: phytoene dehydrogenase [Polyangiaceae bacterium]
MSSRFYDVVVLGRSVGALTAGALLARRDFRVLVLGQGARAPTYRFEQRALGRRAFTLLFGASPLWRRVLSELAQSPQWKRRAEPLDPMFAVLGQSHRIELPPDVEIFAREIEREFPEVRQIVDELYSSVAAANAAVDGAFEHDGVWPPGTLWERLGTAHAASGLPFERGERAPSLLAKFPGGHPYRDIASIPVAFATNLGVPMAELPALAFARLHGAWTRGISALRGGEDELTEFLAERIEAHGGACLFDRRAESLLIQQGKAVGVVLDGAEEPTGASVVVSAESGEKLADLSKGAGVTRAAERDWPRLSPEAGRFVVSIVVRRAGIPESLPIESFVLPSGTRPDPRRPTVHLQRRSRDGSGEARGAREGEALLVAECLLPARSSLTVLEARHAVLETLRSAFPFLDEHTLVVDSVHDGLPLVDFSTGTRREVERLHITATSPGREPMERLWSVEPTGFLGLSGEPVRGPIPNTFLVGPTVLPALGQEGELLAAWSVARLVTRRDKARQRIRQKLWSKIETA